MKFRKSVCTALAIALVSSCAFAPGNNADAQSETREDLAMTGQVFQQTPHRPPAVEKYLIQGKLQAGESHLSDQLKAHPNDDQVRFGLGTLQFLRAIERLCQDLYRYGLRSQSTRGLNLPIMRVTVAKNLRPELLSYQQTRVIVETFLNYLSQAEATLVPIKDPDVKLPLHFGLIRLDLNGDGRADEVESLWKVYAALREQPNVREKTARQFEICFDRGDVHWLRGYCHLLMALCEIYLAHDEKETFECTGHMFFERVETPYKFLATAKHFHNIGGDRDILDLIALIHLIRWPVIEPRRMEAALHHLEAVASQSKESWKWIMAETDDDYEWVPNPKQKGVMPNMHVTDEMVIAWGDLMDQGQKLLAGEVLVPFWRGGGNGINLRKVFMDPRTFDLVLWVQGPAAAPYLQKGQFTTSATWSRLGRVFGGEFTGFALWFN